ncbi:probable calcium-binding protein CML22 [Humulus lupulus]|uniref:probable calcium-binding protein CML22 n=1 Tax=Humulus lupulus TaxID=3486 RepID=UPI002B408978|nr:probable calcium-binding protein CML22 [Humulus lupulus]
MLSLLFLGVGPSQLAGAGAGAATAARIGVGAATAARVGAGVAAAVPAAAAVAAVFAGAAAAADALRNERRIIIVKPPPSPPPSPPRPRKKIQVLVIPQPSKVRKDKMEDVRKAFQTVDTDKDGKINRSEFESALKILEPKLSDEDVTAAFLHVHRNGDQNALVTLEQFLHLFTSGALIYND